MALGVSVLALGVLGGLGNAAGPLVRIQRKATKGEGAPEPSSDQGHALSVDFVKPKEVKAVALWRLDDEKLLFRASRDGSKNKGSKNKEGGLEKNTLLSMAVFEKAGFQRVGGAADGEARRPGWYGLAVWRRDGKAAFTVAEVALKHPKGYLSCKEGDLERSKSAREMAPKEALKRLEALAAQKQVNGTANNP